MSEYSEGDVMLIMKGLEKANAEIATLRAERDELFSENGKLANTFAAENLRLRAALKDAAEWCQIERGKLGAVDGYDYRSGEEHGLCRAQIELERRAHEQEVNPK